MRTWSAVGTACLSSLDKGLLGRVVCTCWLCFCDADRQTALHVAAAEGNLPAVRAVGCLQRTAHAPHSPLQLHSPSHRDTHTCPAKGEKHAAPAKRPVCAAPLLPRPPPPPPRAGARTRRVWG
jgi:hypothetical protein